MLISKWGLPKVWAPIKATTLFKLKNFEVGNLAEQHLPPRHGKGVAEELDCGAAVSNGVWVNLGLGRLVPRLRVSLGKKSRKIDCWEMHLRDRSTSTQSARPVWNLKGRGIVTEQDSSPKLWRQRWLLLILNNIQLLWLNLLSPCTAVSFNAGNIGCFLPKLNGHQGGKGPKIRTGLPRIPEEFSNFQIHFANG